MTSKKRKRVKKETRNYRQFLEYYIPKSGLDIKISDLKSLIFKISLNLAAMLFVGTIFYSIYQGSFNLFYMLGLIFIGTPIFLLASFIVTIVVLVIYIEVMIYRRKVAIEDVLPDFLDLASSNIRSGMTIDKALWAAIRPQFGVLAKEMEMVAKQTMSGEDLEKALIDFGEKYDSPTLRRTVHLIVEGINAGGHIADLLDRIAVNLQHTATLRKEMAANVTTYVIFITFASIVAAPALYGLSHQLVVITQEILGNAEVGGESPIGMSIGGGGGIAEADFTIFAILSISITAFFSAAIISTIKKGNIRSGIRQIPIFIVVGIVVYLLARAGMASMLSGLF